MSKIWWEKTVEYKFVLDFADATGNFFAAPLDGNLETAGDTIFATENKWILIEFKRDFPSLNSEEAKFVDYQAAYDKLFTRDTHHFLVYGKLEPNETLSLECLTYFSQLGSIALDKLLDYAVTTEEFFEYIEILNRYKKQSSQRNGSSSSSGSYTNVIGVNSDGNIVATASIEDVVYQYEQHKGIGEDRSQSQNIEASQHNYFDFNR